MSAPVAIIGAGARTALGRSLPATAAAVRATISNCGEHSFLTDRNGERLKVARAPWLPDQIEGEARFVALAKNALKESVAPVRKIDRQARLLVFVGLPEPRPGRPLDLDETIASTLSELPFVGHRIEEVVTLPAGHAAGIAAIQLAAEAIRSGRADLCVAGGVDSYLEVETLEWLEESGRIHNSRRPWGFTPGEAAGFCLLASPDWSREAAIDPPLFFLAARRATEEARIRDEKVCVGRGLSEAFEGALAPIRTTHERATRLIGDLNGEPYRADELGFALARSSDSVANLGDVLSPAAYWGDVGAASGALFAGFAFAAASRAFDPGNTTLIWAGSEGGHRAAALFRAGRSMHDGEDA